MGINRLLEDLVSTFMEEPPYRDLLIDCKITELVIRILQSHAIDRLLTHPEQYASQMSLAHLALYIRQNIHRLITVDELCRQACMSKPKLFRDFKREFGMTPLQYINHQRIKRACQLLNDPCNSVTDVSFELGFSSVSYFINLFKQVMGITPKQFQSQAHQSATASEKARPIYKATPTLPMRPLMPRHENECSSA